MSQSTESLSSTGTHVVTKPLKSVHKQIFRALLSLASAALLVRVFGMLNQIVVTGRFGAGAEMDAYFVAYSLPYLMGQLGSSAIEASVIPVYARVRLQRKEEAFKLFSTLLNLLLLGTALLTLIMVTLNHQLIHLVAPALDPYRVGLAINLAPLIFPSLLLMIGVSFLECILNAEGQFGWPAYAGLLVPLATAVLVLVAGKSQGVVMLCIGMLVGLSLQLFVVILRARRAKIAYRLTMDLRNPAVWAILRAAWPVLIGALIGQASPLIDQIFASFLSAGSISALSYSLKLISVPVGVIFVSVGRAALPHLSRQASMHDMKAFKETLRLYLWAVGLGTIVLSAIMFVLAHPLVRILFQRGAFSAEDTNRTAITLVGFVVGLTPIALGFIMARAFSALGRTKVLMGVTMFMVIANAVFDYIFARLWQSQGIALATSAVYFCTMFIFFFMLRRMIGKLDLFIPPPEILKFIWQIGLGSFYLRLVTWKEELLFLFLSSFSILRSLRQQIVRFGIMIVVFAVGVFGVFQDSLYTLRAAFGSLIVLALLRYRYALLIAWVIIDVFIGSTLPIFNGKNLDTALTVPTLLLMTCMPIKQTFKRVPALAILFLYLLWVLLGIGISPKDPGSFLKGWTLALDCVAVGVLTINVLTTRQHLLRLIDAILLPATFDSLYGIYGYFTRQNGVVDPTTSLFRIFSITGAAPALALFLSIVIPVAIYRASTLYGSKRVGVLTLVFIFLVALALTFTRTAFICLPVSIMIMIPLLPSRKMKIGLLGSSLVLAVGVVLLATIGNISILGRFFNQDIATFNGRTPLWQALLDRFDPTQLLGNGWHSSDVLLANLGLAGGATSVSPQNLFVTALYDHGIIGLILLIVLLIALAAGLIAGVRKTSGEQRTLFVMALVVFVNMVVQSFNLTDFWAQSIAVYFWIVMALPFALCWSTMKQSTRTNKEALDEVTEPRVKAVQRAKQEQVPHLVSR